MPPTVHKILIHGPSIVRDALLPIGDLTEEALEATNKYLKRFREHHTRKATRVQTNDDLFRRLLLHSDPYITSLQLPQEKPSKFAGEDVRKLLRISEVPSDM